MALKVAIVGCGDMGQGFHAPAFAQTEGVEVVAACNRSEGRAKALAGRYNIPWYTRVAEMLEKEEIDVVDVTTSERDRPEPLLQSLQAGKHIFCEKPLVGANGQGNIDEPDIIKGKEIIDLWRKSGKFFGINFNYRYADHAQALKEQIESGVLGEPIHINAWAHLACWSHVIDMMRWFNGDVEEVSASMRNQESDRDRVATLRFINGSLGTLGGTQHTSWDEDVLHVEYIGTKGRGRISDLCGECVVHIGGRMPQVIWAPPDGDSRSQFEKTFHRSVQSYAIAVRDGKEPPVTGLDAFRELEIDASIAISARRNVPVKIELY
jgi:myo-inositol 2-dehydrogenase / D-chiro-inositol 1-dehydrogenase